MAYVNFSQELKRMWATIKKEERSVEVWRQAFMKKHRKWREDSSEYYSYKRADERLTKAKQELKDFKEKYNLK